jgi:Chaperone of endosialidase
MKTSIPPVLITFALVCFALVQNTQAVSPPPDGGYPGGNTAEGQAALLSRTTGGFNTAVGYLSLRSDTGGSYNTALGAGALLANTADQNTATGAGALLSNTTGLSNTANGAFALQSNTTGSANTATGSSALLVNTGDFNTANGFSALQNNTTGQSNTAIGFNALQSNTTGQVNVGLGSFAGFAVTTADNVICIGSNGGNVSNSCFIGNIDATFEGGSISAVYINSEGQLGTQAPPSARRFKREIKPMDKASEAILALKPVTFHYKSDHTGTPQFGLIAEDVAAANPDLVVHDKDGEIYTVRYDAVNAMLLNEFLKEHKKVEKQEATITRLTNDFQTVSTQQRNEIQLLSAQLKEQASQIQKVSARLEASKPAPQVVNNP